MIGEPLFGWPPQPAHPARLGYRRIQAVPVDPWATRGRQWGFRFLLDGALDDPLPVYERVFAELGSEPNAWRLEGAAGGSRPALRFTDPEGRRGRAGRAMSHDFVVPRPLAESIHSAEDGRERLWPLVASTYSRVWSLERPPTPADLEV